MSGICPFSKEGNNEIEYNPHKFIKNWHKSYQRKAAFYWILFSVGLVSVCLYCAKSVEMNAITINTIGIVSILLSYFSFIYFYGLKIESQFGNFSAKKEHICGIFRSFYDMLMRPSTALCDIDVERMHKYGDIYISYNGLCPVVEVTSSALAEKILKKYEVFAKNDLLDPGLIYPFKWVGNDNIFFANSESWERIRQYIQPAINDVHLFAPVFNRKAAMLCNILKDKVKDTKIGVDVYLIRWLKAVVLDVGGESIFGFDFQYLKEENNAAVDAISHILKEIFNPLRMAFPIINYLPLKSNRLLDNSIQYLNDTLADIIRTIKQDKTSSNQISNMLERLLVGSQNNLISQDELRHNAFVMIIASHETTQISLIAALYYLAKFPALQEKLRAESIALFPNLESDFATLETISSKHEKDNVYTKIRNFHSLGNFILEGMRMHTVVTRPVPRIATEDTELGGMHIPKGTIVNINMTAIHNNPKEWENPEIFNPDRFSKEYSSNRYAYMGFGGGPRVCSGRTFTLVEQKIILCYLLRYFKLELPTPGYKLPIRKKSMFVGVVNESFNLKFKPINDIEKGNELAN